MNDDLLQEGFALALHESARAWRHALDRRLKSLGLSQASWMSIAFLARAKTPLTQSELAHRLLVEGPTVVAMVDRLQRAGLVRREIAPEDRRVRRVLLTPEGQTVYAEVKRIAGAFRQEMLDALDAAELQQAKDLLQRLQRIIEKSGR
ncbi:MarR family transcriptional regulator [Acidithiobacillus ferrooxidans]|jgi:MarR family transcriptional regulator for hemolysin|uniref:MarR family winged helix-turn-helix transcriptional regulator n=1 Tax=Acidithiobacillus ferrooxidans TaxID=920 RepID=UPI0013D53F63|nr:MarR family transcriptional regulator [Acidithiobacillus ferrooxidans]MCR2829372.1 MarR family transcriptional regulator [Acidithiobacillus ferrooxidans]